MNKDPLITIEVIAQARAPKPYTHETPAGLLMECAYVPTLEYGKKVKPWAADLEYRWRVWSAYWDLLDAAHDDDADGWRYVESREALRGFITGLLLPAEYDAQCIAKGDAVWQTVAHNRSQGYWPQMGRAL